MELGVVKFQPGRSQLPQLLSFVRLLSPKERAAGWGGRGVGVKTRQSFETRCDSIRTGEYKKMEPIAISTPLCKSLGRMKLEKGVNCHEKCCGEREKLSTTVLFFNNVVTLGQDRR